MDCLQIQLTCLFLCLLLVLDVILVRGATAVVTTTPTVARAAVTEMTSPCAAAGNCPVVRAISDVRLQVNRTTVVNCRASGQPRPHITWKHQGLTIVSTNRTSATGNWGLEDPSYFSIMSSEQDGMVESTLRLVNGQRAMAGRYSCEGSNIHGNDMKEFDIQTVPIVVPNFNNDKGQTYKEDSSLDMMCVAQGYPKPEIHWNIGSGIKISHGDKCVYPVPPDLCDTKTGITRITAENFQGCQRCPIAGCNTYVVEEIVDCRNNSLAVTVKSRLVIRELSTGQGGSYQCIAKIGNMTTYNTTLIRVHSKLRPLWPSIGIIIEIILLVIIILISEKYVKTKKPRKVDVKKSDGLGGSRDTGSRSPDDRLNSYTVPQRWQHAAVQASVSADSRRGLMTT